MLYNISAERPRIPLKGFILIHRIKVPSIPAIREKIKAWFTESRPAGKGRLAVLSINRSRSRSMIWFSPFDEIVTKNPPATSHQIFTQSNCSDPKTKQNTAEITTSVANRSLPNCA